MRKKQGGNGFMAIKIDFEKAYDRLKCDFIKETLCEMHFPQLMIEVIMECVSSSSLRILWNGEPMNAITPTRGIRQGDPLSPYLFVLCMERLNQVIEEAVLNNLWKPIRASRNGPLLSNLFFADDIMLFSEASPYQAEIICQCLKRFCGASGQKVSLAKSTVYFSNNTPHDARLEVCEKLGMEETADLGMYLGMPTLASRVTRDTFAHLCDKVDRRLAGWKTKHLSLAGRITLAKSTMSSMAYYSMQTAKIPRSLCDELDKKTRRFIWGGTEEKNQFHLLSWETLQKPRDQGGIGIRSSRQANAAFLTKLGWRVLTEPNSLWSRVLRSKYCRGRCDIDMFQPTTNMSNMWRGITDNVNTLTKGAAAAVGNSKNTLFWDHVWAIGEPLREMVVQPIPLSVEGATVNEMWEMGSGWKWNVFSDYLPNDVLKRIAAHELVEDENAGDLLYWKGDKKGAFSIKYAMKIIRNDMSNEPHKQWDLVWKAPVQQRVRVFLWLLMHDRVLCNVNRMKRYLTDDPRCQRCNGQEETLLHLLRDCPAARSIWSAVGGTARYNSFFQGDLQQWITRNLKAEGLIFSEKWPTIFSLTLWWNWRWRNCVVFGRNEDIPSDIGGFLSPKFNEHFQALYDVVIKGSTAHHLCRQEVLIRWQFPPDGWVSLNTDGAAKGAPGLAGGGGILRDHRGGFIKGFSAKYGIGTAVGVVQ